MGCGSSSPQDQNEFDGVIRPAPVPAPAPAPRRLTPHSHTRTVPQRLARFSKWKKELGSTQFGLFGVIPRKYRLYQPFAPDAPNAAKMVIKVEDDQKLDLHVVLPFVAAVGGVVPEFPPTLPTHWIRVGVAGSGAAGQLDISRLSKAERKSQNYPTYQIREFPGQVKRLPITNEPYQLDVKLNNIYGGYRDPATITYYFDRVTSATNINMWHDIVLKTGWPASGTYNYCEAKAMYRGLASRAPGPYEVLFYDQSMQIAYQISPEYLLVLDYDDDGIDVAILRVLPAPGSAPEPRCAFTLRYAASPAEIMRDKNMGKIRTKGKLYEGKVRQFVDRNGIPAPRTIVEKIKLDDLCKDGRALSMSKITVVRMRTEPILAQPFIQTNVGRAYARTYGWDEHAAPIYPVQQVPMPSKVTGMGAPFPPAVASAVPPPPPPSAPSAPSQLV